MKFDLHVHSEYSPDSQSSVREILEVARRRGLDGLAFLDHNTMDAYHEARDPSLIIVPAVEVSTPSGHVGALGVEEGIRRQPDVKTAISQILKRGGIPVALHPYRFWSGIGEDQVRSHEWGALEGLNARTAYKENLKAQSLAGELNIPVIGGSDAHQVEGVGTGYTVVRRVDSWQGLIREIEQGRTGVGGSHRTSTQTLRYVKKSVSQWMGRGFSRM